MDRFVRILATLLTALGVFGGVVLREGTPEPTETVDLAALPLRLENYQGRDVPIEEKTRRMLRSDDLLLRAYEDEAGLPVWILVDYHRTQRLGATIHSPRICYPGAGWSIVSADVDSVPGAMSRPGCWMRLRREGDALLALYWYESRWGRSARETRLKSHIVRSAMARRASDAALVRISTRIEDGDEEGARARLLRFLSVVEDPVRRALPFLEATSS